MKARIKKRWNIESDRDFWLIMLTFSLAGMAILSIRTVLFPLLGIKPSTPFWIKALVYIPLFPPMYYLGLLVFGSLLGQYPFFKHFIFDRAAAILRRRKNVQH